MHHLVVIHTLELSLNIELGNSHSLTLSPFQAFPWFSGSFGCPRAPFIDSFIQKRKKKERKFSIRILVTWHHNLWVPSK
jgi:hypothetical protein